MRRAEAPLMGRAEAKYELQPDEAGMRRRKTGIPGPERGGVRGTSCPEVAETLPGSPPHGAEMADGYYVGPPRSAPSGDGMAIDQTAKTARNGET